MPAIQNTERNSKTKKDGADKDVARFHQIVENGSMDELKQAIASGYDVNAPGHIERTALMVAITAKDLEKIKLLIEHGADPELTD